MLVNQPIELQSHVPWPVSEQVADAIDAAADQDQITWITEDGKKVAAIVPVEVAEYAERFPTAF
jgi:hypothetical protein